jgi:hypothetical protein
MVRQRLTAGLTWEVKAVTALLEERGRGECAHAAQTPSARPKFLRDFSLLQKKSHSKKEKNNMCITQKSHFWFQPSFALAQGVR